MVLAIHHIHVRGDARPTHTFCPFANRFPVRQQRAVPMLLKNAPAVFHRVVFAMIRRIVHQLNRPFDLVRELNHPLDKLRSMTFQLRPIVQVNLQSFDVLVMFLAITPPEHFAGKPRASMTMIQCDGCLKFSSGGSREFSWLHFESLRLFFRPVVLSCLPP